ncbi:MAG: fasciclin domain-containing protein [Nocardioides sp.]
MKLNTLRRNGSIMAAALALSVSLAACSSEDEPETAPDEATSEEAPAPEPEEPASEEPEAGGAEGTFGDGCAQVPTSGPGSFDGMVQDPVATAASNNPLLSTLVAAVGAVPGLADTLNSAEELTVFAPANPAFEAIPPADLEALLGQPEALGAILSYHVIPTKLDTADVVGEQESLTGDTVTVEGDETGMTVNGVDVLCGNIQTANATVYVIGEVLMAG